MSAEVRAAVEWVRAGGLVAYATETVWGLGADACSDAAVASLRRWKGRSDDAPLSVLVEALNLRASARRKAKPVHLHSTYSERAK